MRVGWLGLGAMGAPMAACLARSGHLVRGYDLQPERVSALAADGVQGAESIAAAIDNADVAAVMVATADQAGQVLFGQSGVASALPRGSIVIIMSTVGPDFVVSAAERLAGSGIPVVDAPVSGGVQRAGDGDLLIMPSGASGPVARVRPLLDALARKAPVVGPLPGDGQRMKLVNQLLCGVHIAAAAEALAFAESIGLDPATCWNVLRHGAAASFMLDERGARMIAGEFSEALSAMDIFVKDMGLVGSAARHAGAFVPLAAAARQLYDRGHDLGLGQLDDSAVIEVLRSSAHPSPSSPAVVATPVTSSSCPPKL
jgi:3-hydroxyisobutyrate dehydrogenase/putative dehydrogenase